MAGLQLDFRATGFNIQLGIGGLAGGGGGGAGGRIKLFAGSNQPLDTFAEPGLPGASRAAEAIALLETLTRSDTLADFLTLPAYERID